MKTNKQVYRIAWLFMLGGALFISFVLSLLYNLTNSNIVYYVTVLPDILSVLIDLSETAIFALAFSLLFYTAFSENTLRSTYRVFGIYLCAALLRRIGDLALALILFRVLDIEDIINNVIFLALDVLLGLTALLIAKKRSTHYHREAKKGSNSSVLFEDTAFEEKPDTSALYPFKKIVGKENPLQFCSLLMGIILSAERILFRILFDIDYGAPESANEMLVMIVYYASDILIGIIFYSVSILIYHWLFRQKKKKDRSSE